MKKLLTLALLTAAVLTAGPAHADVINNLIDPYLRIHKGLLKEKFDTVKSEAAIIATVATELGAEAAKLVVTARKLEAAKDIKAVRAAFSAFTDEFLSYADRMKMILPEDLKVAYCPMVKQSWMQKTEEIANPYAKDMLTCGSFKKK